MSDFADRYPFVMTQSLIWRDMDAYLHINNAVYFRYFEDTRMVLFDRIGASAYKDETDVGPILASTRCDYRAPLTFPDSIQIGAGVADIQARRFTMRYAVWSERLERLAAEGEGLLVYYDYRLGRSCEIPAPIRAELEKLRLADA